ncbi:glutamate decarboxylase [Stackebrandtia albiflava]|uniref:glutamate decarboxylase n=1 Tax=Stackebrandtia albiflava TaxID=406432 RepID=A0A562URP4_9ACTN|nr:pyridoxal-dependent decarboxylase [Stackebrandtia albiflava]TWJ08284.1 glutamate decarboxylase [Stackebrandtia albiflava]
MLLTSLCLLTGATNPPAGRDAGDAAAVLRRSTGVAPERNLADYSSLWQCPELAAIDRRYRRHNLGHRAAHPEMAAAERDCLGILARLWRHPTPENPVGCSTTGSSEACLLAGLALLRRWRGRRGPAGRPNLVVSRSAHPCWRRFCAYWQVEFRTVPPAPGSLQPDPAALAGSCDADTIGMVAILGDSESGRYEPVAGMAAALDALADFRGVDVPMHVDAASGGFVAPFLDPLLSWDFRLPRVVSINTSGHNFGMAALGLGWLLWRDSGCCPPELRQPTGRPGAPPMGFTYSRSAAPVLQQRHLLTRPLAIERYRLAHGYCRDAAATINRMMAARAGVRLLNPAPDLPVSSFQDTDPDGRAVRDFAARMAARGWFVPTFRSQADPAGPLCARVVVRSGLPGQLVDELIADVAVTLDGTGLAGSGEPG